MDTLRNLLPFLVQVYLSLLNLEPPIYIKLTTLQALSFHETEWGIKPDDDFILILYAFSESVPFRLK